MIKRIFDIVSFPFYFIYFLLSFPFKIVKIIRDDKIEKRSYNGSKFSSQTNGEGLIDIGRILFAGHKTDFETFFNKFLKDKKTFLTENE